MVADVSNIPSLARLFHIELTKPFSMDPMGYNVLMHVIVHWFGVSAFAMRFPSMLGYLLMQLCLFGFVRRISTERAASMAIALTCLGGVVNYGSEARPYGTLLGLCGLVLLSWQTATRRDSDRMLPLIILSLSLALAINTQYYAVILFIPLGAAELVRYVERKKPDIPMLLSLLGGVAGLAAALPFARALSHYSTNHRPTEVNPHFISHAYFWLIVGNVAGGAQTQHLIGAGILVLGVVLLGVFARLRSRITLSLPRAELTFVLLLAAYPIFAFLLGRFVTYFVVARYVQPAIIGLAAILAILLAPLLTIRKAAYSFFALVFVAIALTSFLRIRSDYDDGRKILDSVQLDPRTTSSLGSHPDRPIYTFESYAFFVLREYSPNQEVRSHITLVYPGKSSFAGVPGDVMWQEANKSDAGVPNIVSLESLSEHGMEGLFLLYPGDEPWVAVSTHNAAMQHLGKIFDGDLVSFRLP